MSDVTVNEGDLGTMVGETLIENEDEYEERARRMGWRPLAEYRGPRERWVDAKTFVEKGEQELPVLRDRYRKLDSELAKQSNQLTESNKRIAEMASVLNEFRDMSRNAEERAYNRALQDISARERQAVSDANTEEWERIQREKATIVPPKVPTAPVVETRAAETTPPVQERPPSNPVIDGWIAENTWFNTDPVLTAYAIDVDKMVKQDYPTWTVGEQLAEVKKRTVSKFPEKFGNPRREAPVAVATPGTTASRPKGKSIKDLPRDAQDAFARFKKQMPEFTEAEYMKIYGEM